MEKELMPFTLPTDAEIMLIQPNNVTFGQYQITDWQENLLTLISDGIQKHMTREKELSVDLFGQPYIDIVCDEAGGVRNKAKVLREAVELTKKTFSFKWLHPRMKKTIETTGVIITTVHDLKGTNKITVNFNPWAIPFLLYYGVGVGGTRYSKKMALTLRGNYTKRIYKILCSQRDRAEYYYPLEQLRKDLEIPESKSNSDIKRDILETSRMRIKEGGSDVWFDYDFICRFPQKGRKPKADTVVFRIQTANPAKVGGEHFDMYAYVHRWMGYCFKTSSSKPVDVIEKLIKLGALKAVYDRALFYDEEVLRGDKTREHAENSLKKMLRENYKIE